MKKKYFILIAIVLAVAAGLAATAVAQGRGGRFGRHGGMLRHMTRALNLTVEQQTQIKGILKAERAKTQPLMQQLRQNQQAESGNVTGNFDETQARAFADKQAQITSDLIVEKQRTQAQVYAVLTPDQRQKALQLMQERQQRRHRHMHNDSQQPAPQTPAAPQTPGQ
jgi:protein CpxP